MYNALDFLRSKKNIFSVFAFMCVVFIFLPFIVEARTDDCSTTVFSDGLAAKTLVFPAGGGYNSDAKVSLPMSATIGATSVDLVPKTIIGTPYIWIPNSADSTLAQIRTTDGTLVKLYQNGVGGFPASSFSNNSRITLIPGGDVWVANRGNTMLTWLEPIGGGSEEYKYGGQVDMGQNLIRGITFDKVGNIWAGTLGGSLGGGDRIKVICARAGCGGKGTVLATLNPATSYGMIGDKYGFVWVQTGSGIASYTYSSGTITLIDSAPLTTPYGVGIDNDSNIWVGKHNGWVPNGAVYKITRNTSGGIISVVEHPDTMAGHGGVAGTGDNKIWTASYGSGKVSLFDSAGNHINDFGAGTNAHGVAVDFDNKVWVVNVGGGSPSGPVLNPSGCAGAGTVTVYKTDTTYVGTYSTCGNGPYNYSDMTGFRSIPNALSVGSSEFMPTSGNTYTGFGAPLKAALVACTCKDASGIEQCAIDPSEINNCLVPLSLFSVSGGDYEAKNLSIKCSVTFPDLTTGLVPCGRFDDNPATTIDEKQPCSICAMFYMLKNIINFVLELALGLGVFVLVIGGLFYGMSTGDSGRIESAKKAITSAIIGMAIVFTAWLLVAVILQGMGYGNMTDWNQIASC